MNSSITRRSFLETTTTAAVASAAALSPWLVSGADQPAGKRAIKKAIMWETVGLKGSVLEKCKAIKEAGFEGVEPSSHSNQDEVMKALEETIVKFNKELEPFRVPRAQQQ